MSIAPRCICEFPFGDRDPYCPRHGHPFSRFNKFITRTEVVIAIEQFIAAWPRLKLTKKDLAAVTLAHAPIFALLAKAQQSPPEER